MEKVLEIALDNGIKETRYWTLNYHIGCDAKFFEGGEVDGKRVFPLKEAKIWAKANGYTHLEVISLTRGKTNKIYCL